MRKQMTNRNGRLSSQEERELDQNIYGWWKQGGWFGELDSSGNYVPKMEDDDGGGQQDQQRVLNVVCSRRRRFGMGYGRQGK